MHLNIGKPITQGELVRLFARAIDIDILNAVSYGEKVQYEKRVGYTILSKNFNIYKGEGIVNGNSNTLLNGKSSLRTDEVLIDNIVYKTGQTNAGDLLGYYVEFYYKENDGYDNELLYITPDISRNDVLVISAENIIGYEDGKLFYEGIGSSNTIRTVTIPFDADIIYNGRFVPDFSPELFLIDSGEIRFIDANNEGWYKTILIDRLEYYVVSAVDINMKKIYDKYHKEGLNVDADDKDIRVSIKDTAGKAMKLEDIKEWDVLTVRQSTSSEGVKVIDVIACRNVAESVISEISIHETSTQSYITIDDATSYKLSGQLLKMINDGTVSMLDVGDNAKLYMNDRNEIVYIKKGQLSAADFAYVIAANRDGGLSKRFEFKVLKSSGEIAILGCADKLVLDSDYIKSDDEKLYNKFMDANGKTIRQPIYYSVNANGEINKIETAKVANSVSDMAEGELYTLTPNGPVSLSYKKTGKYFNGGQYNILDHTLIFQVPGDPAAEDKYYAVVDKGTLQTGVVYTFTAYTVSGVNNNADLIVMESSGYGKLFKGSDLLLINKISQVVRSDGEVIGLLTGLVRGKEVSVYYRDERSDADKQALPLSKGDVIRYTVGVNDELIITGNSTENFEFILDADGDNNKPKLIKSIDVSSGDSLVTGKGVYMQKDGYIWVNDRHDMENLNSMRAFNAQAFPICVYDSEKKEYRKGTIGEIIDYKSNRSDYSFVLVHVVSQKPAVLVVYN